MKRISLITLIMCFSTMILKAQELTNRIEVIGKADIEIIPEVLNYSITLQEYKKSEGVKVNIETLEKQLTKAVEGLGISKENFSILNVSGNKSYSPDNKQNSFLESRNYIIRVSSVNEINGLIPKLDSMGVTSAYMSRATLKKNPVTEKLLRTEALKDAKSKATSIAEGIDKKLGDIVLIQEMNLYDFVDNNNNVQYKKQQEVGVVIRGFKTDIPVEKIKLSYQVKVTFQMK
jgi:uncharacterized protein